MISRELLDRYYPSDRPDTTQIFYEWVRQHLCANSVVLNLGAGPSTRMPLRTLRGEVARVVGVDPDPIVLKNDELDEAHVVSDGILPFGDSSFDLILSDFVLEHVQDADLFLGEVFRTLKPGRPFFFRTPNLYHYVSLISRFTPHWFHKLAANRARGLSSKTHEPWPTFYNMNRGSRLRSLARRNRFQEIEILFAEAHPAYLLFHPLPFMCGVAYERLVNRFNGLAQLRVHILGKMVR